MAQLTAFSFRPGNTLLHKLDVRFKLILLVLISLSTVNAGMSSLAAISLAFIFPARMLRISVLGCLTELRYFFLLLALVFLARLFSTPGVPLFTLGFVTVTKNGLHEGLLVCWRLFLVVWLGIFFVSSTRIAHIKWAVAWFLSPLPLIPEKRIATMMGLIVRFIPMIFQKTHDVSEAQKARCSDHIHNPILRLKRLAFPMVKRVFLDADKVASAMAARCYSEKAIRTLSAPHPRDWLLLGLGIVFCMVVYFLK
jgi:energy-coupling factor transporter transmembrane protein EcfT